MSPKFTAHMQEFGDHETAIPARVNYLLLDRIHRAMREEKIPFTLRSSEQLEYGYTVPLTLLARSFTNPNLVPLAPSELPLAEQERFGQQLYRILQKEEGRIAVIASADLTHHLVPGSTETHPEAIQYDETLRQAARSKDLTALIAASATLPADQHPCGERPIAILMGLLQSLNTHYEELCYEAPFNVGYLTGSYRVA